LFEEAQPFLPEEIMSSFLTEIYQMETSLSAKCVINESGLSILPSQGRKWDVERYLPYFGARFREFFAWRKKKGQQ
jgi:hypothetical protein